MVFVLDNYDSFTYNLVQYLGELGARVHVRRNDELSVEEVEALHPERILLSPGPCTPAEAGILVPLIRHMAGKVPISGVSRSAGSVRYTGTSVCCFASASNSLGLGKIWVLALFTSPSVMAYAALARFRKAAAGPHWKATAPAR